MSGMFEQEAIDLKVRQATDRIGEDANPCCRRMISQYPFEQCGIDVYLGFFVIISNLASYFEKEIKLFLGDRLSLQIAYTDEQ